MTKSANNSSESISEQLNKLEHITEWFENQEQIDVEQGLIKVKEGVKVIKELKTKLKSVENEFQVLQNELNELD